MEPQWVKLDKVHSTNSYLVEQIQAEKANESMVVLADYQEAGRGQGANRWHSRSGENLIMSRVLFPAFLSASDQFHISRIASLAIYDFLESLELKIRIKWPNDIITENGKIAGILIEHGITEKLISHSVIGIGLNLNQSLFPEFPVRAVSLVKEKGITMEPIKAAEALFNHLNLRYTMLKEGSTEKLKRDYLDRLYGFEKELAFSSGNESFLGVIRGLSEFGELQVEKDGIVETFGFQEIRFESVS